MTITTRKLLNVLREAGLTARSSCHPMSAKTFTNVEVLDMKVINVCAHSVLGTGCWNHPDYNKVVDEMADSVALALTALGIPYSRPGHGNHGRSSDQFFINGYKA